MGQKDTGNSCLLTKVYLCIWSLSLLLPLLDDHFFGNGAGGLDIRPLTDADHRYLFPLVYCILGSLLLGVSLGITVTLACAAHAIDLYIRFGRLPTVWDHEQWAIQIELSFLFIYLPYCLSSHAASLTKTEVSFRKICQQQFVILYAAAAFWKLNSGFFDPAVSCGTVLILETLSTFLPSQFFTPDLTVLLGQYSPHKTVLMEGLIAATMAFRSTRNAAIVIATLFHLLIILLPVNAAGGFSMDCTTRFIVFFTSMELERYFSKLSILKEGTIFAVVSAALVVLRLNCTGTPFDFNFFGMSLLTAFYLRLLAFCPGESNDHKMRIWSFSSILQRAILLSMTLAYGFVTIILGLQHMGAPSMYSNLRYYGGGNHYLVPVAILSDDLIYGGGLVQVVESTSVAVNRRLAYIPSEEVYPPVALHNIRVATGESTLPVQFFPLCLSNPFSREVLADDYEAANPPGSTNLVPFILPISDLNAALQEEIQENSTFVVKFMYEGTSKRFQGPTMNPESLVVWTETGCEIQAMDGTRIGQCDDDPAVQLIREPPVGWVQWLVSKLQTPYPQMVGFREEICMS